MAELVLVRPGFSNPMEAHWSLVPPLGLAYLAASAREKGIGVAVVDGKLEKHFDVQTTVDRILSNAPFFVGISAMTFEYPIAVRIASKLKSIRPELILVLGGVHANALPQKSLQESDSFDFVMAGECERSLVSLIESIKGKEKKESVPGLFWRDSSGIIMHGPPPRSSELSEIPFPAWDLFPRTKVYALMTERGCPYNCVFCSHNMGRRVRSRALKSVKDEMEWLWRNFKPREVYIEDETFGIDPDRTKELLIWLADFNQGKGVTFKAQTRIDRVTEELMVMMKRAGFDYVELGVESGDDEILKKSFKGIRVSEVEEMVKIVKRAGLRPWVNFILGLPGESERSVRNTIDLAVRLNPDWISVALIVPYPGCRIYEWARRGERGYSLVSDDWSFYDKYMGSESLKIMGLSFSRLKRLQIKTYLYTFLKNFRLAKLIKLFWGSRNLIRL